MWTEKGSNYLKLFKTKESRGESIIIIIINLTKVTAEVLDEKETEFRHMEAVVDMFEEYEEYTYWTVRTTIVYTVHMDKTESCVKET